MALRRRVGLAFNTPFTLTAAGPDPALLDVALDEAVAAVRRVERATSVYKKDGDLGRLNRDGRVDHPDPHLVRLLRYAAALSVDTGGRFDCTVQPLWDVWAAHHERGERPSPAVLRSTAALADWRGVGIEDGAVHLSRAGMAVTLNSLNQGYAADIAMAALAARGVEHALVDTGEFGARGRHPGEGGAARDWRLGVAAPRDPQRVAFTLDPFRRFAATSGDYKTSFSPDFSDHHIFDPGSGTSPPHWSSITVEAETGLDADGLATALFVLDETAARQLLGTRPGVRAHFTDKAGVAAVVAA